MKYSPGSPLCVRKRKPYTTEESEALWNYIVKNNLNHRLNRRSTWRAIARALHSSRSVECLRSHYRHVLLPRFGGAFDTRLKRRLFTPDEDHQILSYVETNNLHDLITSRSVWVEIRQKLSIKRSVDSMRSRFRRCLSQQILFSGRRSHASGLNETAIVCPTSTKAKTLTATHEPSSNEIFGSSNCTRTCSLETCPQSPKRLCNSRPVRYRSVLIPKTARLAIQNMPASNPAPLFSPRDTLGLSQTSCSGCVASSVALITKSTNILVTTVQAYQLISMTNGLVNEVINFLRTGYRRPEQHSRSPPIWTPSDDARLQSSDSQAIQSVVDRFGEDEVCLRLAYLES